MYINIYIYSGVIKFSWEILALNGGWDTGKAIINGGFPIATGPLPEGIRDEV